MIAFDLSSLSATQVANLKPGQLFWYCGSNACVLALRLDWSDQVAWLNLSGENAFRMDCLSKQKRELLALPMPIEASDLRIRVDHASGSLDLADNAPGRVVFEDEGALIAARWIDLDHRYFNAVVWGNWRGLTGVQPKFAFERWALSYRDESGQWVDLVTRVPAAAGQ